MLSVFWASCDPDKLMPEVYHHTFPSSLGWQRGVSMHHHCIMSLLFFMWPFNSGISALVGIPAKILFFCEIAGLWTKAVVPAISFHTQTWLCLMSLL
jgi:hypothetical protein